VIAFAASEVFRYGISALGARTSGLRVYKQDLVLTLAVASTALVGVFSYRMAHRLVGKSTEPAARVGALIQGTIVFVAVSVVWALIFAVHHRRKHSAKLLALV